jgi:alpha-2-macroglobulin
MFRFLEWFRINLETVPRIAGALVHWIRSYSTPSALVVAVVVVLGIGITLPREPTDSPEQPITIGIASLDICPAGTIRTESNGDCVKPTKLQYVTGQAKSGNVYAQINLARMYAKGENTETDLVEAEYWYRAAINQGDHSAMNELAYLWAEAEVNLGEAESMSRTSLEGSPDQPRYLDTLGWILYKKSEFTDAIGYLEDAILNVPYRDRTKNGAIWAHLVMTLSEAGFTARAHEKLRQAKLFLPAEHAALSQFRFQKSVTARASVDENSGTACIRFDRRINKSSGSLYADYLSVSPQVDDLVVTVRGAEICASGLAFGEIYQISVLPGLPSVDELTTIQGPTQDVFVAHPSPKMAFRERGYILPQFGNQVIPLEITGFSEAKIKVLRIPERNLLNGIDDDFLTNIRRWEVDNIEQSEGSLVFEGIVEFQGNTRKSSTAGLSVEDLLGHQLESGLYVIIADKVDNDGRRWDSVATQWFVVSDIGTSLFWGPDGLHVQTRSLNSAKPLAGISVSLVARNNRVLATVKTDEKGYIRIAPALLNGKGGDQPLFVLTEGDEAGFSFVNLGQAAFDFRDRGVGGRKVPEPVDGYLFSERGIYRPGEDVYLTGFVRDDKGNALEGNLPLTLVIVRPDGVEVDRKILRSTAVSAYTSKFALDTGVAMGEWSAHLYVDVSGTPIGSANFQVADFVPPKIEVDVIGEVVKNDVTNQLNLNVSADYFFGAPAKGLRVKPGARISLLENPYPEFTDFHFGLVEEEFSPITVKIDEGQLNENGEVTIAATINTYPSSTVPLALDVRADVFEPGGRVQSARTTIPLNNLSSALGIRPLFDENRVASDARAAFEVVLLDSSGALLKNKALDISLYREHRHYTWFIRSGTWDYEFYTTDELIEESNATTSPTGRGAIDVSVSWGAYRLEVRDPDTMAISSYRFYAGWGGDASGPDIPDSLNVKLDQEDYVVGETARLFVAPPFAGELVLVLAGKELEFISVGHIPTEGKIVEIPISEKWANEPGLYVMPIVYRPGDKSLKQQSGRAIGVSWMKLNYQARTLQVNLELPSEIRSDQPLKVVVDTGSVSPDTYVTVAAVDDAVLGLTQYKSPDPSGYFFAQRQLAYEIRDTYGYLINPYGADRAIIQSGGDTSAERMDRGLSVRSSKVVSLYSGIMKTNSDGIGEVTLDIPQFSGRLRVMAIAWNAKQVGSAAKSLQVRDPIVAELVLPRFLAPGDRADATATLHNVSGLAGSYKVVFSTSGPVDIEHNLEQIHSLALNESKSASIPVLGTGVGTANITMAVSGPDAFYVEKSWDIEVRPIQPIMVENKFVRLESGNSEVLSGDILRPYLAGTASAVLSVGSVPSFGLQSLVDDMIRYPYRCLEQTTSRAMAFLFGAGRYPSEGVVSSFPPKYVDQIRAAIRRLSSLQRTDGSFGLWSSNDPVERWLSAYATDFISRAKTAGFHVPFALHENAIGWLSASIQSGYFTDTQLSPAAYAHYVLARTNRGNLSKLRHFVDTSGDRFPSSVEWGFMASALTSYGDEDRASMARRKMLSLSDNLNESRYDYYSSWRRQRAALIHLAAEMEDPDEKFVGMAFALAKDLAHTKHMSTQESAWIAMAARSVEAWASDYQVDGNGTLWRGPDPTRTALSQQSLEQGFTVTNSGSDDTIYELSIRGIKGETLPPATNGYTVKRELFGENGKPASLNDIKQGDVFLVRLSGGRNNASSGWRIAQAMIVDFLPAGFEIETVDTNEYPIKMPASSSMRKNSIQFENGRDDRYVAAIDLSRGEQFEVQYIVRAVSRGNYAYPAPYVESMYEPDQFARGVVGSVEVR